MKNLESQLLDASVSGNLEKVKYLVEQGVNIHAFNDKAVRWASDRGYLEVVKYLVKQGADIHAFNDQAIRHADIEGHDAVVRYLLSLEPIYWLTHYHWHIKGLTKRLLKK